MYQISPQAQIDRYIPNNQFGWISSVLMAFIALAFIQLNMQKLLYLALGLTEGQGGSALLYSWLLAPLLTWMCGLYFTVKTGRINSGEFLLITWLLLVVFHALFFTVSQGAAYGVLSLLAWSTWVGLIFVYGRGGDPRFSYFILWLFFCAALVNGIIVIAEVVFDYELFKVVTRDGVVRRYGISQSISILGLQIAIGVISGLALLVFYDKLSFLRKSLILMSVIFLLGALIVTTSRGPAVFLLLGIIYLLFCWLETLKARLLVLGAVLVVSALIVFFINIELVNATYIKFLLLSLASTDDGNVERFSLYWRAIEYFIGHEMSIILGSGSGSLSVMANRLGGGEFSTESSVLKFVMEFGLIGSIPILFFTVGVLFKGIYRQKKYRDRQIAPFIAMFIVIVLESLIHESLKSWLIQFYFWGVITVLVMLSRYARERAVQSYHKG